MTTRRNWLARSVKIAVGAAAAVTLLAAAKTATAQDFPPPPGEGGPGGRGGFGGPGGPMGRGGMRGGMGRPASLSTAPIEALSAALNLSDTQEEKIKGLQKTWQETERTERQSSGIQPPRPRFGGPDGDPPSDEDREAMRAQFQKFMEQQQAFDKKLEPKRKAAESEMSGVLTDAQKKALPNALKSIDALQRAGIPAPLQADLKLTSAQREKLAAVADKYAPKPGERPQFGQRGPGGFGGPGGPGGGRRGEARTAVLAVLTDSQKKAVADWEKDHPRPERGPGGFGPPGGPGGPGGGPDGFPPPPSGE